MSLVIAATPGVTTSDTVLYENASFKYEYLDISSRGLDVDALDGVFRTLHEDTVIKAINFSNNLTQVESDKPLHMEKLFRALRSMLTVNRTLMMIQASDNFLFQHTPSSSNEHRKNYLIELSSILSTSKIKRLDISGNNAIGKSGNQLKGLSHLCSNYLLPHADAFICRNNGLHSQAFAVVADALGVYSSLTYLDLSDNIGGIGSFNEPNSNGTFVLAGQLQQTIHLRVLKLARNRLGDVDFQNISQAISFMLHLQYLDVAGNECHAAGMEALKNGLASLCPCMDENDGLRDVNVSNNPIGSLGAKFVSEFVMKTATLVSLNVSHCGFDNDGMTSLQHALMENVTILQFDNAGNPVSEIVEIKTKAAVEVNQILVDIREDPLQLDSSELTNILYDTLVHKLRHLPLNTLIGLHNNPSFNVPLTPLQQELHLLAAPDRQALVGKVIKQDKNLPARLRAVHLMEKKLHASGVICRALWPWFCKMRQKKLIKKALLEAKKKEETNDGRVRDDSDTYTFWRK